MENFPSRHTLGEKGLCWEGRSDKNQSCSILIQKTGACRWRFVLTLKLFKYKLWFLISDLWNIQVGKCIDFTKHCGGPKVFPPAHECRSRIWKTVLFKSKRSFLTFLASMKPTILLLTLILELIFMCCLVLSHWLPRSHL